MFDHQTEARLEQFAKTFRFKDVGQVVRFVMKRFMSDVELQNNFVAELVESAPTSNDPEVKKYRSDLEASFKADEETASLFDIPTEPEQEPIKEEPKPEQPTYQVGDKTYVADDVENDSMGDRIYNVPRTPLVTDEWEDDELQIQRAEAKIKSLEKQAQDVYKKHGAKREVPIVGMRVASPVYEEWDDERDMKAAIQKSQELQEKYYGKKA